MKIEVRLRQPVPECVDSPSVRVVEVRPRAEHLDGLDAAGRDLHQVRQREAAVEKKLCRDAEATVMHGETTPDPRTRLDPAVILAARGEHPAMQSAKFGEVLGKKPVQLAEPGVCHQGCACVAERARDVMEIGRVRSRDRLKPEGAQRFQVALQGH